MDDLLLLDEIDGYGNDHAADMEEKEISVLDKLSESFSQEQCHEPSQYIDVNRKVEKEINEENLLLIIHDNISPKEKETELSTKIEGGYKEEETNDVLVREGRNEECASNNVLSLLQGNISVGQKGEEDTNEAIVLNTFPIATSNLSEKSKKSDTLERNVEVIPIGLEQTDPKEENSAQLIENGIIQQNVSPVDKVFKEDKDKWKSENILRDINTESSEETFDLEVNSLGCSLLIIPSKTIISAQDKESNEEIINDFVKSDNLEEGSQNNMGENKNSSIQFSTKPKGKAVDAMDDDIKEDLLVMEDLKLVCSDIEDDSIFMLPDIEDEHLLPINLRRKANIKLSNTVDLETLLPHLLDVNITLPEELGIEPIEMREIIEVSATNDDLIVLKKEISKSVQDGAQCLLDSLQEPRKRSRQYEGSEVEDTKKGNISDDIIDKRANTQRCSDPKISFTASPQLIFQLFEIPETMVTEAYVNGVPLESLSHGRLLELLPGDMIAINDHEYYATENAPFYVLIKDKYSEWSNGPVTCTRRTITCVGQTKILIDDQDFSVSRDQELIVANPGQKLELNDELHYLGKGEYCWIDVYDADSPHRCVWHDPVIPVFVDGSIVPFNDEPRTYWTPINLGTIDIHDEAVKKVTIVPVDTFQCNRYTAKIVPVGCCVTTESGSSVLQSNGIVIIRDVPSLTLDEERPLRLSANQCVIVIGDENISSDTFMCQEHGDGQYEEHTEPGKMKQKQKRMSLVVSDLLQRNNEIRPLFLSEDTLQRARDVIDSIITRPNKERRLSENLEIIFELDSLEEWIKRCHSELHNALRPDISDDITMLATKQSRLKFMETEKDNKITDIDLLELRLEQHCDFISEDKARELRIRYANLIAGVNSLKLLVHNNLEEVESSMKQIKKKESLKTIQPREDEKLINSSHTHSIREEKPAVNLSRRLSTQIHDYKGLLEQLQLSGSTDAIGSDSDRKDSCNDQEQRILWQLLLTQCRTRIAQVNDACRSKVSKSLSPSFTSWKSRSTERRMSLSTIREEIEGTLQSCVNGDEDCERHVYNLLKSMEEAMQWIENRIIAKKFDPTNSELRVRELTNSMRDQLERLVDHNKDIVPRLNAKNAKLYDTIQTNLSERIAILERSQFTDAQMQTSDNINVIKDRLNKSIQTFKKVDNRRVSFADSVKIKKEIGCHVTEYCNTLSELVSKSCDIGSFDNPSTDLRTTSDLEYEMQAMALHLDDLTLVLEETLGSDCQYERLLNNYGQFLSTGDNKLQGNYILISNIDDIKSTVNQFKEYFSNFHIYRECLESLRLKVSPDLAERLYDKHLGIIKKSDVIEERAHQKLVELLKVLYEWLDFDDNFKKMTHCLEDARRTFSNVRSSTSTSQSNEDISIIESVQMELLVNTSKVGYILDKGKSIAERLSNSNLKTDIEGFKEKWDDICKNVSLTLDMEKRVQELSREYESNTEELSEHMNSIKEIIWQLHELMNVNEENISFQQIVKRQTNIYHVKVNFYSKEKLKSTWLKLGDELMKTKRYDMTKLNRCLCSMENQWEGICEDIRDVEEVSLSPLFSLKTDEIPRADVMSLLGTMTISLNTGDRRLSVTGVGILADNPRSVQLRLSTFRPMIDLYCQRHGDQATATIRNNMAEISHELNERISQTNELTIQIKKIEELMAKINKWITNQIEKCQKISQELDSRMNVKLAMTKLKTFEEEAQYQQLNLTQAREIVADIFTKDLLLDMDKRHLSNWLSTTEQLLLSELDKQSSMRQLVTSLLKIWSDLEKQELNIIEAEIEIEHFVCQSNSLCFSTLACVKSNLLRLIALKEELFGAVGSYTICEANVKLIQQELQVNRCKFVKIKTSSLISSKSELSNRIRIYSQQLETLISNWENYDDWLKSTNQMILTVESFIKDCYEPDVLNHHQELNKGIEKLDKMITDADSATKNLSLYSKRLTERVDEISVRKLCNMAAVIGHRLHRIEIYRDRLKLRQSQFNNDHTLLGLHCKTMENIANSVSEKFSTTKILCSSTDGMEEDFCDLLKEIVGSRNNINEIKSISHRFLIDDSRRNELHMVVVRREQIIHDICQAIQDLEIDRSSTMDFSQLCNHFMDFIRFLEPLLSFGNMTQFSEVIEQQITFEYLQLLLRPKESIILILIEKGNKINRVFDSCSHFDSNLAELKSQWENIVKQIQIGKTSFDKNVCAFHDFIGQVEQFNQWCDNLNSRLVDFEAEVWSVDEMSRLEFQMTILNQEKDVYETVFKECLKAGDVLFDNAVDEETRTRIEMAQRELSTNWADLDRNISIKAEKLRLRYSAWKNVDDDMENLFVWIKELEDFITSEIPYYEGLNYNLQRTQKFMVDLKSLESGRHELRTTVTELSNYLSPDDVTIIFNREHLIDKQCQELGIQLESRSREIKDRMSVWPQFITDWRTLMHDFSEITEQLDVKNDFQVDEMIQKLEEEIIPRITNLEAKVNDIRVRGYNIQENSGETRSTDIKYRVEKVIDAWTSATQSATLQLKELKEMYDSIGCFEEKSSKLRDWIMDMREWLRRPIVLERFSLDIPESLLNECDKRSESIVCHTTDVKAILYLCNILIRNPDACPTSVAKEGVLKTRKKLDKRWEFIKTKVLNRRTKLNSIVTSWTYMERRMNETEGFINRMDDRLQNLVRNLEDRTNDNLDKLEVMKRDIEVYEFEIKEFIQYFDTMSQQDQLDNNGQIEAKVKNLQGRFETIQQDLSVMIKHMKMLLGVKMELGKSCATIEQRIADIERDIENTSSTDSCRVDLQNIRTQFIKELEILKLLDFDSKDLKGTLTSDSMQFSYLFDQLKRSQRIFSELSSQYGNIIRSSSANSDIYSNSRKRSSTNITIQYGDVGVINERRPSVRRANALVQEFILHINVCDQFLRWLEDLLQSSSTDIHSVVLEDSTNGNTTMNSFTDLVLQGRYKIDLVKGLDAEIKMLMSTYQLLGLDDYNPQASIDLEFRWKVAYELAERRDNKNTVKTNLLTPKTSTSSSRFDRKGSSECYSTTIDSRKGSKILFSDAPEIRKCSSDSRRSARSSKHYDELPKIDTLYDDQLTLLQDWINVSLTQVKNGRNRTDLTNKYKVNLRHLKSELEELGYFLNEFVRWETKYQEHVGSIDGRVRESWELLGILTQSWINNIQQVVLNTSEIRYDINNISNQLRGMERDFVNRRYFPNSAIDLFDEVKNEHRYWKHQLMPISSRATHHLRLDQHLSNSITVFLDELINLDSLVNKISMAIIEDDSRYDTKSKYKSPAAGPTIDDADTTAPLLTSSSSLSNDDDIINDSSLMIPSISSFEQPYIASMSGDYNHLDTSSLRLRLINKLPPDDGVFHLDNPQLPYGDCSSSVPNNEPMNNATSSDWYIRLIRCFLAFVLINMLILLFLFIVFMIQPDCENSWECSASLPSITLKKHWSKSAAI